MALDGIFLKLLLKEIEQYALDARIEKVYQPGKDEIVLALRGRGFAGKLLISANSSMPRLHFTSYAPENPSSPPMLCMLLRKHLTGARLIGIRQPGLERAAFLDFDCINEFGDKVRYTLAVEIMARHSNIILIDENGIITDAVKRVDAQMSRQRQILPGEQYTLPPAQPKVDFTELASRGIDKVIEQIKLGKNEELSKKLLSLLQGCSPIVCREIAYFAGRGNEITSNEITNDQLDRLKFYLNRICNIANLQDTEKLSAPRMVIRADTGKPMDFTYLNISQYGIAATVKEYDSYCELLDEFYYQRDRQERIKRKAQDLLKVLSNASERISRKINAQTTELKQCENREQLKIYGDLITANLYKLEKGMLSCEVENYYEEDNPLIKIKLDPAKTPTQNAQKYYKDYRKAQTAEKILYEQIEKGKQELIYIDSVFDALSRADTDRELNEIRQELALQGYVKMHNKGRQKPPAPLKPYEFISDDGFIIKSGRNNMQNDKLTLKDSHSGDIWFHTKNIPGSHTVIIARGAKVPDKTLEQAAVIAAYYSRASDSVQVPVDYTLIKNVRKPQGAKPGMVIYTDYKTAYVNPDKQLVERLLKQDK